MSTDKLPPIDVGFQVYLEDGGDPFGAVRDVSRRSRGGIIIDIEGAGDFEIPLEAIKAVHFGKVILDATRVDARTRDAIRHAHDREVPGL